MADSLSPGLEDDDPETPFCEKSWQIKVSHVGDHLTKQIAASDAARDWLAGELDVLECEDLVCDVELSPGRRGRFVGSLHVQATFLQTCVVSLEPFKTRIEETIAAEFWPQSQIETWNADRGKEAEVDDETPDPEPIVDERLPVGRIVHQAVVMAVDPHPRKPGAEFGSVSTETEEERAAEKPFSGLAKLRDTLS